MIERESDPQFDYLIPIFDNVAHCKALGMTVVWVRPKEGLLRVGWNERFIGNPDTGHVHGGVVTTILDTVGGLAVLAAVPPESGIATLDLRIDYMRPATKGVPIYGYANCFKATRNVAFVRGYAFQDDPDDPIGNCVGTYMLNATSFSGDQEVKD